MTRQWLPRRTDAPGIMLAALLGCLALGVARSMPASPWLSDILVALLLGIAVLNSPLRKLVQLEVPGPERQPDRYASGLRYIGKWVLRLGIIAMGLKVKASFFGARELALVAGVILVCLPSAYLIAHALGSLAGLRWPFADLLGIGTMICGASAINAAAPVVRARRAEQGIAIGVVFLFSIVAMLTFHPIASWLGLSSRMAGIWAGLAVNDLSSAVAVGKQMGPDGAVMAAAAKSARILALAPILLGLSLGRRRVATASVSAGVMATLPKFILGYVALAVVRAAGDSMWGASLHWARLLWFDDLLVDLLLCTVAAAIGLHLGLRTLFKSGARAIAVGAGTSLWMASTALLMVTATARQADWVAGLVGGGALMLSALAYRAACSEKRRRKVRQARLRSGQWLSLFEASQALDDAVAEGCFDPTMRQRIMAQLQPAIGELIPVRETPIEDGDNCRWTPYWVGDNGWTLGAVLRSAGSVTAIHHHPQEMIGKAIEGDIEEVRFRRRGDALHVVSVEPLQHNRVVRSASGSGPHLVAVSDAGSAIDIQLRGPLAATQPPLPAEPRLVDRKGETLRFGDVPRWRHGSLPG